VEKAALTYSFLTQSITLFFLIFARVGPAFALSAGFGESFVSPRIRLALALSCSFCLFFPLKFPLSTVAEVPSLGLFLGEVALGLLMGLCIRIAFLTLETTGTAISMFSGLHLGSFFSPFSPQGASPYGSFLTLTVLTFLFLGDWHHSLLRGLVESYHLHSPGQPFPSLNLAHFAEEVNSCFLLSLKLAAPFFVMQVLFSLGVGLVNRLVAPIPLYFLAQPVQILMGLLTLSLCLPFLLRTFLTFFGNIFSPGRNVLFPAS
jgi:flagellar biosynthetic protein FliR